MKKWPPILLFLALIVLAMANPIRAQQTRDAARAKQEQRLEKERLASQFYRSQEWEKAKPLYLALYQQFNSQHYFSYYLNCLIQLNDFEEAEKQLKAEINKNPGSANFMVDLGYMYQLQGNQRKAERLFGKIIKDLIPERNRIAVTANAFRARNLDNYALEAYNFGSEQPSADYPFYLEKAGLYQYQGDYNLAFDNYLYQLDYQPQHIDLIKSRLQSVLRMDIDNSMTDLLRAKLLQKAQQAPDNMLYGELLIWFSLQQKDYDIALIQAKALDRRQGDRELQILDLADISMSNQAYDIALDGFEYVRSKGKNGIYYVQSVVGLLQAKYLIEQQKNTRDESVYKALASTIENTFDELGFNPEVYPLALTLARIYTYELAQADEAVVILEKALKLPLNPVETSMIKLQLADIYLYKDEVWEATLLYSQIEKRLGDEPIGHEARYRNARLRYYIGEFEWANTQLNVLKAATSKLIANDAMSLSLLIKDILMEDTTGSTLKVFAQADLKALQGLDLEAATALDSLNTAVSNAVITPRILMRKAELAIKKNDFLTADSLFSIIYKSYPDSYLADEALYESAMLNALSIQNEEVAREKFQLLIDTYPASVYVAEARRRYRMLRGDNF